MSVTEAGESRERMSDRIAELEAAIARHRAQKADDRCIEDDDKLYEVLGDGIRCDRRVGDKSLMIANCYRFIERRCESGGWTSYVELEKELNEGHSLLDELGALPRHYHATWPRGGIIVPTTRSLSERIEQLLEQLLTKGES